MNEKINKITNTLVKPKKLRQIKSKQNPKNKKTYTNM